MCTTFGFILHARRVSGKHFLRATTAICTLTRSSYFLAGTQSNSIDVWIKLTDTPALHFVCYWIVVNTGRSTCNKLGDWKNLFIRGGRYNNSCCGGRCSDVKHCGPSVIGIKWYVMRSRTPSGRCLASEKDAETVSIERQLRHLFWSSFFRLSPFPM